MEQTPSITLAVDLTDQKQRAAVRAFLDVMDGGSVVATTKHEKPAAAPPATNTRKPVDKPKAEPETGAKGETGEDELTMDDLTSRVRSINEAGGNITKDLKGLLKPFGVDRVSNLDPSDWRAFYDKLNAY